jgi:hypothetical protein
MHFKPMAALDSPPETGKNHLATTLGVEAVKAGRTV